MTFSAHGTATIDVFSGGVISNAIINSGGLDQIFRGGTASGTTVNSGGEELVSFGGTASGAVVSNGGVQTLTFSGTTIGTVVSSGGQQSLTNGNAIGSGTTVRNGGVLLVNEGASATSGVLSSGATASVFDGGDALGTTVLSGATLSVFLVGGSAPAVASGTILNGGEEIVSGTPNIELLALVNSGGLELVEAGGQLASATISGVVEAAYNRALNCAVTFAASGGGTVQLDATGSASGEVSGFAAGDDIDFRAIAFSGGTLSWSQFGTGGTLSVSSGANTASVTLLGNYADGQTLSVTNGQTSAGLIVQSGAQFASASDSAGGTDVTFNPVFMRVVVSSGGVVSNTIVNSRGSLHIEASGVDNGRCSSTGGLRTSRAARPPTRSLPMVACRTTLARRSARWPRAAARNLCLGAGSPATQQF